MEEPPLEREVLEAESGGLQGQIDGLNSEEGKAVTAADLAAALAKATGPTPGRRGRTGIAVASQRRRAPAQPSPALAAAAQDFSAPPPDQRGKR